MFQFNISKALKERIRERVPFYEEKNKEQGKTENAVFWKGTTNALKDLLKEQFIKTLLLYCFWNLDFWYSFD